MKKLNEIYNTHIEYVIDSSNLNFNFEKSEDYEKIRDLLRDEM